MRYLILLFFIIIIPVMAQEASEARITEHNVVSVVAVAGLLSFSYLVRKRRKLVPNDSSNINE